MKIIMLIDMDYFYAACEELRHPEYKGKPLIVGGEIREGYARGVVNTANYEARKYGIHSAMPLFMAKRLKSDAIFLGADYEYYEKMSKKVMDIIRGFADKFEQVSIDEAFIDVTAKVGELKGAVEYGNKIRGAIRKEVGLPCTIGMGTNRIIAKMASDVAKPDGIRLVRPDEAAQFLSQMPVGKLYGVGKKIEERLLAMGYKTIGDLAKGSPMKLIDQFGVFGSELHRYANGQGEDQIIENYEVKSIGRERTFGSDTRSEEQMIDLIKNISKEVAEEVKRQGLSFRTVTLKLKYANFEEHLKSKSIGHSSNQLNDLIENAVILFNVGIEKGELVRKIGVRVSGFMDYKGQKKMSDFT